MFLAKTNSSAWECYIDSIAKKNLPLLERGSIFESILYCSSQRSFDFITAIPDLWPYLRLYIS